MIAKRLYYKNIILFSYSLARGLDIRPSIIDTGLGLYLRLIEKSSTVKKYNSEQSNQEDERGRIYF